MSELPGASRSLTSTVAHGSNSPGFILDGSSSLLFTSNGASSEDIDPTDGQYGSVVMRVFGRDGENPPSSPAIELWTNLDAGRFIP